MRPIIALAFFSLVLALAGCSHSATPPAGRWEGIYDAGNTVVAVRMEINDKGDIFISAPNAEGIGAMSSEEHAAVRQKLADGLDSSWDSVKPLNLDFDGKTFRKPGGIAPQAEWDANQMTLIVYLGDQSIRIPLRGVKMFSPNPFSNA